MDYNKKIVNELWQEHEPYIRKLCTYKLKSLPDYVDDCIQDVFLALSDALHKGKVIEYPKAWLTKVANNADDINTMNTEYVNSTAGEGRINAGR
ncbi:MAG: sigma-70 family RNA polymerase sigma factor [Oscillospiraceae bacterium]|nr:sigma-70 family RNA polymerase sigma factor [Oscillospiraceae bacterium]